MQKKFIMKLQTKKRQASNKEIKNLKNNILCNLFRQFLIIIVKFFVVFSFRETVNTIQFSKKSHKNPFETVIQEPEENSFYFFFLPSPPFTPSPITSPYPPYPLTPLPLTPHPSPTSLPPSFFFCRKNAPCNIIMNASTN